MFRKIWFTSFIVMASITSFLRAEVEVRRITPPKLNSSYLGQRVLCHRPMRMGSPKVSVEQRYGKIIVNNYGHGGGGWTLAPGSADYANYLLLNSEYVKGLTKDTPITVLGAGVIGLFAAYDLITKGYKNLTIVAESVDAQTSHTSGGLIAPVSMDNDNKIKKIVYKIAFKAYSFYKVIAEKKHPHFKEGAIILSAYFERRGDSGLEPYVGVVMEPAKDVILDFGNGTTRPMVAYDDGIFVDTDKMLAAVTNYLKKNGVKFVRKKIHSFSQIRDKFIINCTGMGAKDLNDDGKLVSVQGHLIMLKNQNPSDLQYVITAWLEDGITKSGQKIRRSVSFFPKHLPNSNANDIGAIGSTYVEGATYITPNNEEFDILSKKAREFFGIR